MALGGRSAGFACRRRGIVGNIDVLFLLSADSRERCLPTEESKDTPDLLHDYEVCQGSGEVRGGCWAERERGA